MEFDKAVEYILNEEGGYVWDKVDPGGETNFGISKRAYPKEDIKNMTRERAKFLYKRDYWDKVKAEQLPKDLRLPVFDFAVNAGVSRAIKLLQKLSGVKQDGIIGPITIQAANLVSPYDYKLGRLDYYRSLVSNNPQLSRFIKGWTNRTNRIYNLTISEDRIA